MTTIRNIKLMLNSRFFETTNDHFSSINLALTLLCVLLSDLVIVTFLMLNQMIVQRETKVVWNEEVLSRWKIRLFITTHSPPFHNP